MPCRHETQRLKSLSKRGSWREALQVLPELSLCSTFTWFSLAFFLFKPFEMTLEMVSKFISAIFNLLECWFHFSWGCQQTWSRIWSSASWAETQWDDANSRSIELGLRLRSRVRRVNFLHYLCSFGDFWCLYIYLYLIWIYTFSSLTSHIIYVYNIIYYNHTIVYACWRYMHVILSFKSMKPLKPAK